MLKLEKIARTRDLNVILRDKPLMLTRTFLLALGYALLIHFGAILIFHIAPFKIGYGDSIHPPTTVATDLHSQSLNKISIHLEDENPIPAYVIAPAPTIPEIPIALEFTMFKQLEYIKQRSPLENPFLSIENNVRTQDVETLFAGPVQYAPVSIHISGGLSDTILVQKKTFEDELAKIAARFVGIEKNTSYRYLFNVQVEQKSGEIFWWEKKSGEDDKELKKLAFQILENIRFEANPQEFVSSGDVEIVLIPHI